MITGAEISLGINALKTAVGIAKEAKELKDASAIHEKVIEMQSLILEAQGSAIEARDAHSAQAARIRELEQELSRFQAWDSEKERYQLQEIYPGSFAYALKSGSQGLEPAHMICPTCYNKSHKTILQKSSAIHLKCPTCETTVQFKQSGSMAMTARVSRSRDW